MVRKRNKAEEIVGKLWKADVLHGQGVSIAGSDAATGNQ